MSDYQPGTVAVATVRGVEGVRVMRPDQPGDPIWLSVAHVGGWRSHTREDVTDVRPLVVLDLGDAPEGDDMKYGAWLRGSASIDESHLGRGNYRPTFLRWVADQIEAQTKPPRIPEPGLWGVVEDPVRNEYVRANQSGDFRWLRVGPSSPHFAQWVTWDSIEEPLLVREGLS